MDEATAALFPSRFTNDGLPEGWHERPFAHVLQIIGGGTPKTSTADYWDGAIPWYSVVDAPAQGGIFVVDTEKTITTRALDRSAACVVSAGTTIISARGTVEKLAMTGVDMTFNQSCYGLRGKDSAGDGFVYFAAAHLVEKLRDMAHGSVFSTITRNTFGSVHLAKPPQNVLAAYESAVATMLSRMKAATVEARTLAALRDALLPKLMSGEIRIRDAEHVAEVA